MDLGIAGRKAFVSGASKGLGRACALALAQEGARVTILARDPGRLEEAAADMRAATGSEVNWVAGDITTETGRAAALAACPDPEILVNNAGDAPPRGDCLQWEMEDWRAALNDHMLTSVMMIRATAPGMVERGFGRVVNITSGVVKMPIANMALATAPRLGLIDPFTTMTAPHPVASRSLDRTGVRCPGQGAPSARETTIGQGFPSPYPHDKGRSAIYRTGC